jgi:GMP synthase-like glutamine amidotransferase
VRSEWDCPHCRKPGIPKTPIYTHIGHNGDLKKCGDYSGCIFERGPHNVRIVKSDAVFANLPDEFEVMQSHCGQIEFAPAGWELIGAGGAGSKTKVQCIKKRDFPVYAAQFHIEMEGTPEVSRQIMENFLNLAERSKVGLR